MGAVSVALAASAPFAGVLSAGFLAWGDPTWVTSDDARENGRIGAAIAHAVDARDDALFAPLAWISHLVDRELFGFSAAGHHATSLVLHVAASLLLYAALVRATASVTKSAAAAALFAAHPIHVESVAWIAERKGLLSGCLVMAALAAHVNWTRGARLRWLGAATLAHALAVLAHPLAVTTPGLLLVADAWPIGGRARVAHRALFEKLPMFGISVAASFAALDATRDADLLPTFFDVGPRARLALAGHSFAAYLGRMLLPLHLAPFHDPIELVQRSYVPTLALAALAVAALAAHRYAPYLAAGGAWAVVALAPVLGLVVFGGQSVDDRHAYVAVAGPSIAVVFGLFALGERVPRARGTARAAVAALVATAAFGSVRLTPAWQSSLSLARHAAATIATETAERELGRALTLAGDPESALPHLDAAIARAPNDSRAHTARGTALLSLGRPVESATAFRRAIALDEHDAEATIALGESLFAQGRFDEALVPMADVASLRPARAEPLYRLADAFTALDLRREAVYFYTEALRYGDDEPDAHAHMASALAAWGGYDVAVARYRVAVNLSPRDPRLRHALAVVLTRRGRIREAIEQAGTARDLAPEAPGYQRDFEMLLALRAKLEAEGAPLP